VVVITDQHDIVSHARRAPSMRLFLQAHDYARSLGRDDWDFALELPSICSAGMTVNDLRWLLYEGYVEHACEVHSEGAPSRQFRDMGKRTFTQRSCFVITTRGVSLARQLCVDYPDAAHSPSTGLAATSLGLTHPSNDLSASTPHWDSDRRELRICGVLVKQFKLPSSNQEAILDAFEEEAWPIRIDDPLPPRSEMNSKRRLHDTIKSLNRHQKSRSLRFLGDGRGEGVRWESLQSGLAEA